MSRLLDGRAIVVTGAGRGLGRAYAEGIAVAGGAVLVNDVDAEAADRVASRIRTAGGKARAFAGSVAEWDTAAALIDACIGEFGRIDGLVTNAAITHHADPWDETEDGLRSIAAVNILGVQFTARHAMRAMVQARRGGSIVNVVSGAQFGIRGMSAYGASKGAVAAMTANWALAGEDHSIRVNALSPLAMTRMAALDTREERPDLPDPAAIAPAVVALLSDAVAPLTGAMVRFDGTRLSTYGTDLAPVSSAPAWSAADIARVLREAA